MKVYSFIPARLQAALGSAGFWGLGPGVNTSLTVVIPTVEDSSSPSSNRPDNIG